MSLLAEIIPFTLRTGTGTQTISHVRYPSIAAKAIIFMGCDGNNTNSQIYSMGFDDGTTHLGTSVGASKNPFGDDILTARGFFRNYSLASTQAQAFFGGADTRMRGYVSAINVGSFDITFDINFTPGNNWIAVVIGGTDISCKVGVADRSASPITVNVGFTPAAILKLNTPGVGVNGSVSGASASYGLATVCDAKQVAWGISADWVGNGAVSYQLADKLQANISTPSTTVSNFATLDSWAVNGFVVTDPNAADWNIGYLAIGGGGAAANLVSLTQPTVIGTQDTAIDAVDPAIVFLASTNKVATTGVGATDSNLSLGVFDTVTTYSQWWGVINGATRNGALRSSTKALTMATATGINASSVNADATCVLSSQNLALNWTNVDSTQREVWALVLATNPTPADTNPCGTLAPDTLTLTCPVSVGQVGLTYSSSFTATGGIPPYTFSIIAGALPNGLVLTPSTGAVTGTPTLAGTYSFTGKVIDSGVSSTTTNCSIVISGVAPPPCDPITTPENSMTLNSGVSISGF